MVLHRFGKSSQNTFVFIREKDDSAIGKFAHHPIKDLKSAHSLRPGTMTDPERIASANSLKLDLGVPMNPSAVPRLSK
jgi:hypothetical protein